MSMFRRRLMMMQGAASPTLLQYVTAPAATADTPSPVAVLDTVALQSFDVRFEFEDFPVSSDYANSIMRDLTLTDGCNTVIEIRRTGSSTLRVASTHGPDYSSGGSQRSVTSGITGEFRATFASNSSQGTVSLLIDYSVKYTNTRSYVNSVFSPQVGFELLQTGTSQSATIRYKSVTVNGVLYAPATLNGVAGFWCETKKQFYPSNNTTPFTAGPQQE